METEYELRAAAYEAVAHGDAEIVGELHGEPLFVLTDSGRERADRIIDAAIATYGDDAGACLAEALGVDVEIGEQLVALRDSRN